MIKGEGLVVGMDGDVHAAPHHSVREGYLEGGEEKMTGMTPWFLKQVPKILEEERAGEGSSGVFEGSEVAKGRFWSDNSDLVLRDKI